MTTNPENQNVERFRIALLSDWQDTWQNDGFNVSEAPNYFFKGTFEEVEKFVISLLNKGTETKQGDTAIIWFLDNKCRRTVIRVDRVEIFSRKASVWYTDGYCGWPWSVGSDGKIYSDNY